MSPSFETAAFSEKEREKLLDEVREHLPLFLKGSAEERAHPLTDLQAITGLDPVDLRRVVAVHVCLSDRVDAFLSALQAGLRTPMSAAGSVTEIGQNVRGPVDWEATARERAATGNDPTTFVTRPGDRARATPENEALAWALRELDARAGRALALQSGEDEAKLKTWRARLLAVRRKARGALATTWLRPIAPKRPDRRVVARVSRVPMPFYRRQLAPLLLLLLTAEEPDPKRLTEMLCERYFLPERTAELFEVVVALRIAKAVEQKVGRPRKRRLLAGAKAPRSFAWYVLDDGDEVELIYQRWPHDTVTSRRALAAQRHGMSVWPSKPDFSIVRTGGMSDCFVLEVKATRRRRYLAQGLSEALAYLGEQPELLTKMPAAWLVAPASDVFDSAVPDADTPLWMVSADDIGDAVVDRLGL